MISELRVRQALASSIYFDPCFLLSSAVYLYTALSFALSPYHRLSVSVSRIASATFHLQPSRGLLSRCLFPLKAVEFHESQRGTADIGLYFIK